MMSTDDTNYKIYRGTVDLKIKVDCVNDIPDGATVTLEVEKPDGDTESWDATVEDKRYAIYYTEEGDLDESGIYRVQAKVTTDTGVYYGNTDRMLVHDKFS